MSRWAGSEVTAARKAWKPRLPLPCYRCGKPVLPEQVWHVEHIVDRALGGSHGPENQWVSHAGCNMSAGGQRGAAITNARRVDVRPRASTMAPERDRRIRGW